jgi:hypothetical protein
MKPAVLFLDICKFSQIPSYDEAVQDNVLRVLNLFMAEMLYVIRAHQGEFEKNTAMVCWPTSRGSHYRRAFG